MMSSQEVLLCVPSDQPDTVLVGLDLDKFEISVPFLFWPGFKEV